ncbi:MAG: LysR family transcriptional regulator [Pseudomonadota bacterium]
MKPELAIEDEALLRRLRMFLAVIDEGGVTEAAKALGKTQPAITTQVKALEADLQVALFRRVGRKLALTEKGEEIAALSRRALGELSTSINKILEATTGPTPPLRLGFSAPQTMLQAAAAFKRTDPNTQLELRGATTQELFGGLDSYALDVIMIGLDAPLPRYHCQHYTRQSVVVALPEGDERATTGALTLRELSEIPIVLREEGSFTREVLLRAFQRAKLSPQIAFEVSTREAVAEAVRRGFGAGPVLSEEANALPGLTFCALENSEVFADDYLVCHHSALSYGPVARFLAANAPAAP